MKYKDLTEAEVKKMVAAHHRFTTEEMSLEDAIEIFKPLKNGSFFRSYILLEEIVPKEYLKEKEFFKGIIPLRYPLTYRSVLAYADSSLKNDRELIDFAIDTHGSDAISALVDHIDPENTEVLKEAKKDKNVYIEPSKNSDGEIISYKICSNLLKDTNFISDTLKKAEQTKDNRYIASSLMDASSTCSSNLEMAIKAVSIDASSILCADKELFENEKFLTVCFRSLIENNKYGYAKNIDRRYEKENKEVQKLIKICKKIFELPSDAKLRTKIYQKMAKVYLSRLEKNIEDVAGV